MESKEHKVFFKLEQDEDEWPPVSVESVWADRVGENRFKLNNVPYFAKDVSYGDIIECEILEDVPWFLRLLESSNNSTVHVFCFDSKIMSDFTAWLKSKNC